ncbi:ABC transporter permease [Rhizobiaceae bacterium BDR2-2]|uniref:ABC transporter permease n=1 Tax=Ectorhizobium quercum TaxID=2965071 RepID=A0AAE3MZJ9_9HYPH|nr:ABC transporter permease [Ectorhizobium quercum]MCX8997257.1 ABC transporter permease [Ectorhizobium quercum]
MFWFLQRVAISLALLWVVTSLVFLSIYMVPGDPAELLLSGEGTTPDPASVAQLRAELGLDRPVLAQYAERMAGLARFDLGNSMIDGSPVASEIASRLPRTLELVAAAAILSLIAGIPAGVVAALRQGGRFDRAANFLAGFSQGIPVFVAGTLIILLFAQIWRLVPAGGYANFTDAPGRHLILLSMPAGAIAIGLAAIVFRIARASVLDVLPLDYVRTARAKGLPQGRIVARHILRNALMPVITVFALNLGGLFGGTVLVEYVFNWPGLSGMLVSAVNSRDYPTVTAVILVISALFITLNLVVDILYGITDPRVRK